MPWAGVDDPHADIRAMLGKNDGDIFGRKCSCGRGDAYWGSRARHARNHLAWDEGLPLPKNDWRAGVLTVVDRRSRRADQKLAYDMGELFRRERHYDFPLVPRPGAWYEPEGIKAYLPHTQNKIVGLLIFMRTSTRARWTWGEDGSHKDLDGEPQYHGEFPTVAGIFVCRAYRRRGIGRRLVEIAAQDAGVSPEQIAWGPPLSDDGNALARAVSPAAIYFGR